MEQYHLVRLGMRVGIGSKASIGRDLCNDTPLPPPWSFIPSLGIMYFAHGTPEAFLSLESSPVETRKPRGRYVIIPYAHDSFYSRGAFSCRVSLKGDNWDGRNSSAEPWPRGINYREGRHLAKNELITD
ncbi:hypothetical protein J3E68DRAFT_247904 [Trichoderma sp. SZMC 28012]